MKRDREDLKGRADTDASLATERGAVNDAIDRAVANAEKQLDFLIARDRVLADEGISRVRRHADKSLAGERSMLSVPSPQVVDERVATDYRKQAERSATDALFERERDRVDEHIEADREKESSAEVWHQAHREDTDEHLSIERSEADAVAAERDASEMALEAARSAEEERTGVFAMVAHDLRSPLSVIVGNADMIAEGAEDALMREAAGDITRAAARMGRLLVDLLDLARIDAETFRLDRQPHSLTTLLSELRLSYCPVFEDRGVTLSVDVPSEDLVATFDHDRVVQLLSNLLGNAVKFTPRGGSVDLWVERDPEKLVFVVRDDGAGIPPSALSHLFERFWQSDTDRRRGLGLGLYLCRTIARAHGGEISVQSEVGSGSTFRVCLPMSR